MVQSPTAQLKKILTSEIVIAIRYEGVLPPSGLKVINAALAFANIQSQGTGMTFGLGHCLVSRDVRAYGGLVFY